MVADARLENRAVSQRSANWRAGESPSSVMLFRSPPDGRIIHGAALPLGHYELRAHPPWYARGMMLFFHQQAVDTEPAA